MKTVIAAIAVAQAEARAWLEGHSVARRGAGYKDDGMAFRLMILLVMLPMLGACATPLPSDISLSKTTSRTLPEREVARRVTAQLTDILLPAEQQAPNPEARNPLYWMAYDMAARPADNASGICLQDRAFFDFAPSGPREGADTRVRVSSVRTDLQIIVPAGRDGYDKVRSGDTQADALCARVRDTPAYARFTADNAYAGIAAFKAFEALRTAIASQPDFPLDCTDADIDGRDCRTRLKRLVAADINHAKDCGRDRQKPRPNHCLTVWTGNFALQIFVDQAGVPQYALADELISFSHPRKD